MGYYYYDLPLSSVVADAEAKQNLLKSMPEIEENYNVISKIGEGISI